MSQVVFQQNVWFSGNINASIHHIRQKIIKEQKKYPRTHGSSEEGEIPPVGKKQAIFLFRGLNLSPDPEFEKQHLDKRKWQEPSSKTKNWAARFKGGVDEGHQKGPGGELGI